MGDLDFRAREIQVERALSAGQIETPKSGQGRTVDMSEQLMRTLRRLEIDRMVEKLPPRMVGDAIVGVLHGGGDPA